MGTRRPQPSQAQLVSSDLLDHSPRRGGRGDRAEQLGLVAQDCQVAQTVPTIGQHHRQVPQDRRGLGVPAGLATAGTPAQFSEELEPVGQLGK
jgi:hypothetical protein